MYTRRQASTIYRAYKEGKINMTAAQVKHLYDEADRYSHYFVSEEGLSLAINCLIHGVPEDYNELGITTQSLIDEAIKG